MYVLKHILKGCIQELFGLLLKTPNSFLLAYQYLKFYYFSATENEVSASMAMIWDQALNYRFLLDWTLLPFSSPNS